MKIIIFSCTNHELSQRAYIELVEQGHSVTLLFDCNDEEIVEIAAQHQPHLIITSFFKSPIPETILQQYNILSVRSAALTDRGPASQQGTITQSIQNLCISLFQSAKETEVRVISTRHTSERQAKIARHFYRHHAAQAAVQNILDAVAKLDARSLEKDHSTLHQQFQSRGRLHSFSMQ